MIDIIIPIFNARDTLPFTLMSIAIQKVSTSFTVTLVDDCSTDSYDDILERFHSLFSLHMVRLDVNSGAGVAREEGLSSTYGDYVLFMDADDLFYDSQSLSKLYSCILDGYDMVSGMEFDEKRNASFINEGDLHGKLYRRSFLKRMNIHFNSSRVHEDNYFNNLVLLREAKNTILSDLVYIYCYNLKSLTNKDTNLEFLNLEVMLQNMRDLLLMIPVSSDNVELISHYVFVKYKYFNQIFPFFTKDEQELFKTWIQKYDSDHITFLGVNDELQLEKMIFLHYKNFIIK